jgi:hypothetical protein
MSSVASKILLVLTVVLLTIAVIFLPAAVAEESPPPETVGEVTPGASAGAGSEAPPTEPIGQDIVPTEPSGQDVVVTEEPLRAAERREHRPYASFGYGSLEYRETSFEIRPGLESKAREPVYMGALGWDFLFDRSTVRLGLDLFVTENGTEEWTEAGSLLQTNDFRVWRLSLDAGYLYSSYDTGLPPSDLEGTSKYFRFGAGLNFYYRHQQFQRDDFATFDPPSSDDQSVNEKFDMLGGEVMVEIEVGPRDIAAAFVRGKGGGGLVTVTNDALGSLEEDARIWTAGVQGTIEAGVVSEFLSGVELRAGYRYHRLQVFEETTTVAGILIVNLPDNQTTIHMFFVEASFPF